MNAGLITNKGVEVTFRMVPVRTKDINWEINGNWSLNKNKLNELQNGMGSRNAVADLDLDDHRSRIFVYSYVASPCTSSIRPATTSTHRKARPTRTKR